MAQQNVATVPELEGSETSQKYLTFELANEEYGIEILRVREIIGLLGITKVPQMPEYVKGVINLRGKIHPVIDLRLKFQMEEIEHTKETCIIVVDVKNEGQSTQMGIIVDTVDEVLDILNREIEQAPSFGNMVHAENIVGIGKVKDRVVILLDIERILAGDEINVEEIKDLNINQ